MEFDLDKPRSTDKLTITIIDSMEKDKGVSYNEEIEQFNLDFLLMISLLTITEDKHPKEPFYLNKAVNPVWISFFRQSLNFVSTNDDHPIQKDHNNCSPFSVNWVYQRLLNKHDDHYFDSSPLFKNINQF